MATASETVQYTMVTLPLLGTVGVGYSAKGICYVLTAETEGEFKDGLERRRRRVAQRDDTRRDEWQRLLEGWMKDGRCDASLDVSWLTPFEQAVLARTRTIPRGSVRPYQWLAREVGKPGASRAAGHVMARNPIPLLIPCHRVVAASGLLGQFSMGGPAVKAELLAMEGVDLPHLRELARRGYRYRGNRRTGVFCYPTCGTPSAEDEVLFRTADEATAAGFRPCATCRPV